MKSSERTTVRAQSKTPKRSNNVKRRLETETSSAAADTDTAAMVSDGSSAVVVATNDDEKDDTTTIQQAFQHEPPPASPVMIDLVSTITPLPTPLAESISPPKQKQQQQQHRAMRSSSLKSSRKQHAVEKTDIATSTHSLHERAAAVAVATDSGATGGMIGTTRIAGQSSAALSPATTHGVSVATSRSASAATTPMHTPPQSGLGLVGTTSTATTTAPNNKRIYRTGNKQDNHKWVTRDIASLDFLLHIPLQAERDLVVTGWQLQRQKQQEEDMSSSQHSTSHRNQQQRNSSTIDGTSAAFSLSGASITAKFLDMPSTAKGTWWEKHVQPNSGTTIAATRFGVPKSIINNSDVAELEQPTLAEVVSSAVMDETTKATTTSNAKTATTATPATTTPFVSYAAAPGRRLEGDEAVRIHIPLTFDNTGITKQRSIARQAALREWELQTAHGLAMTKTVTAAVTAVHAPNMAAPAAAAAAAPPMLDGRLFFSANSSYPISVFSVIRYEPKKEEAAIRRRKLEAIGGGGSQFVLPNRDWRGISYRALLRRSGDDTKVDKKFNRFLQKWNSASNQESGGTGGGAADHDTSDASSSSSVSSDDSDDYVPGVLDDPEMVLGRHRTVMIGDRVTGPIVSTTIQFVKPALLKAELNKQFRERFDGWEPPKRARKYIGAKVIQGNYVLMDPTDEFDEQSYERGRRATRTGTSSTNSISTAASDEQPKEKIIRMPPSLTLSKIRSLKNQVLHAAVRANLEIGTVALACVYFERLCLDCRVDKSNRRLAFAACLLLAAKLNEPNLGLVMRHPDGAGSDTNATDGGTGTNSDKPRRLQALIRPNKTSNKMFASLLLFFTQDWSLSLTHLFTAEWGVFAALGFSLDATPIQIAFHFKRLMKTLEWSPLDYLGSTMYTHWQNALVDEEERRVKRERRRERKRQQNEERLLNLHIEIEHEVLRRKTERQTSDEASRDDAEQGDAVNVEQAATRGTATLSTTATKMPPKSPLKPRPAANERRLKLFNRFAQRRSVSTDRLEERGRSTHRRSVDTNTLPMTDGPDHATAATATTTSKGAALPHRRSGSTGRLLHHSPSMPSISSALFSSLTSSSTTALASTPDTANGTGILAIDIPDLGSRSDTSSMGAMVSNNDNTNDDDEGIVI